MSRPPEYRRIADELRRRIEEGIYPPGARLPSIETLRIDEGVSSMTVRQALSVLREEGLIEPYPGSGYYVRDRAEEDWRTRVEERLRKLERRVFGKD